MYARTGKTAAIIVPRMHIRAPCSKVAGGEWSDEPDTVFTITTSTAVTDVAQCLRQQPMLTTTLRVPLPTRYGLTFVGTVEEPLGLKGPPRLPACMKVGAMIGSIYSSSTAVSDCHLQATRCWTSGEL